MAKASIGRATQAKPKPAPSASVGKKAKAKVTAVPAKKKSVAAKPPVKTIAAPKMTAVSKKTSAAAKAPPVKTVAAKAVAAKGKAAPSKPAVSTKAVVGKTTARKAAPPVKIVAAKKAAVRRPAARTPVVPPAARRARAAAAPRKLPTAAPPRAVKAKPAQSFTVSHLNQDDFKTDGLRTYAKYRDLGIAAATGGLCQAHVIRFTPPCTDEVRKRHLHKAELQMVYVLQGWMKNEFEGQGEQMMSAGSCWLQPSGIKHTVLDYSADCEVLEIIVPADFTTEDVV
jgi:hypothetical protein